MRKANVETPTVLTIQNVSKHFVLRHENSIKERILFFRNSKVTKSDFVALDNINLSLNAGQTIGLIGHNGSGKSTLLKIIGGIIEPTAGTVLRRGRLAALLELGAGFHPDLTGRENVYMNAAILGMSRTETEAKFQEIVDFAGIEEFIDTQVKFYSSGMYVRLGFSVAIHTNPDVLLVDEVLAVGDEAFQRKCLDRIAQFQRDGRTIILVTHNLSQVMELCDRAILLDRGNLVFDGPSAEAVAHFRELVELGTPPVSDIAVDRRYIGEVTVKSNEVGNLSVVRTGSDFVIDVKFNEIPDVSHLICAVAIMNPQGQLVFGYQVESSDLSSGNAPRSAQFTINDARMSAGVYSVNVSLVNGENHIHIEDAVATTEFELSAPHVSQGTVFMEAAADFLL